jgi:Leucine-rich repeat (LRR) protein
MQLPEGWPPTATSDTIESLNPDNHFLPLQNAIPDWLGKALPVRREALLNIQPQLLDRLKTAPAAQHQALKRLNAAHLTAQNDVDQQLEHLQDASAFAEPLLKAALKKRFGLDLNVRTTFLRLYVPATIPWFPVKTGARAWTVSLLDAALHNFEAKETHLNAYETDSTYITQPSATGQFDTLPLIKARMSIPAFTQLCRELDIGAQYRSYLDSQLGFSNPADAKALRLKIDASQQAALKAALQWARMNGDISERFSRLISGLADGLGGMRLNGQTLLCHDVTLMSAPLTGIVVFAADLDQVQKTARVVAYVPDDPEHPIKEYASALEMVIELTRQLRSKDYQRFFSRFVNHEQRGFFFAGLNERLTKVTWHPPVAGSSEPAWRGTPLDRPNLQTAFTPISDPLWQHLYQAKLNKILHDARAIAVPTAIVDQRTRWALWDSLVNIASSILQTAAFIIAPFVPVLGEAMMAYMAYQLLDEAFEGIVEWAQGQTREAFEHFMGTVESLIQLGAFAIGGAIGAGEYRNVLPKEIVAFIDRFKPVELPNGQTRYWDPDLARYEQKNIPGPDSIPNELGLHQHQGQQLLPLEDAHFTVSEGPIPGEYRIEHPTQPDAYQPEVRHNGDGAWHTELEQPLEWDKPTALRRIGSSVESFTPEQRETILQVSGYNEDALRKMHVNQESLPPLLADTIKRFKIDQDLKLLVDQLDSERPEHYLRADPLLQLQLINESGRWPIGKRLSFVNHQGEVVWLSSADQTLPLIEIRQGNLIDGDLLKTLFLSLENSEIRSLLGEEFGGPTRPVDISTQALRKQLADLAWQQRTSLFEARYQALERIEDPLAQTITQCDPQLPLSITKELLNTATGDELVQLSEGQLPPRQQALMQLASQEVRVTRAFEGLELDSVSNPDSDTLALHSLKRLPGWSGDVRIEIRDRHYEGPMLDSTGRADAEIQKVLVRKTDGTYQPYDHRGQELQAPTDFYAGILYALPDSERQALNIQIGQAQQLKNAIREHPMERSELRVAISNPLTQESVNDTLRLLGNHGYRRSEPARSSRLSVEYSRLTRQLNRWVHDAPLINPANGVSLTPIERLAVVRNRRFFRDAVQRCWRGETLGHTGHSLYLPDAVMGKLPTLDANFTHVTTLTMNGSLTTGPLEPFLQNFPGLRFLDLHNFNLQNLPPSIASLPTLQQLVLRNCGLTLPPADQFTLSSLTELSLLDLMDNPLSDSPNVQAMPALQFLNLANTGISEPPAGLLDRPHPMIARFDGNQITELPDVFFRLPGDVGAQLDFSRNPLSAATQDRVKVYFNRTGVRFRVLAEQADIARATNLFTGLTADQATDLLYRLPGTLAQGRTQLARWESEIIRLNDDLAHWSNDIPRYSPLTGEILDDAQLTHERLARSTFAQALEHAWRNRLATEFAPTLRFMGDMPVLTADFSHVSDLTLMGNTQVLAPHPFLACFPNLQHLNLQSFALDHLPRAIGRMPRLGTLVLDNCGLVMTPEIENALSSLNTLDTLKLINNTLAIAPDVSTLPRLTHLDLSNSGISIVPGELANHQNLNKVFFGGNRITELPEAFFQLTPDRASGFNFAANPLSTTTRNRIKTYFREQGKDFGVMADPTDINLTQDLFPDLDRLEASNVIYDLPGTLDDGRLQLEHWRIELKQLIGDLRIWERHPTEPHPATGQALDAEQVEIQRLFKAEFSKEIEQFWRRRMAPGSQEGTRRPANSRLRDDYFAADIKFSGEMPLLTTDFGHVCALELRGTNTLRATDPFLELFTNLQSLDMKDFALQRFPKAINRMPTLRELVLRNCQVTLTPEGQATLSSLVTLENLDLSENPLAFTLNIEAMPVLSDIRLSNAGLSELPIGLAGRQNLRTAIINGNRITELPEDFFNLDPFIADGINLANNPLSPVSRNRIKAFYALHGNDLAVHAEQADINQLRSLFPQLNTEDASHMIYKLPGTLEDGRIQMSKWTEEVARLASDLRDWRDDIPAHDPTSGALLSPDDLLTQRAQRAAFSQALEQLWHQRVKLTTELRANTFSANLGFVGDMPVLSADFSHVTELVLKANEGLTLSSVFLENFTGLYQLAVHDAAVNRIPQSISGMKALENLTLNNCGVVFNDEGQAVLASLSHLDTLDLANNPLGQIPDISALPTLKHLDLSGTGIDHIPAALTNPPQLDFALFSNNRITELPEEIYNLSAEIADGFDFSNNPLSDQTRDRIKTYFQKTGSNLEILAPLDDIAQVKVLYPSFSREHASEFIYGLPGSLADGRLELARKHAELDDLRRDLTVWMTDIPNDPLTGNPLDAEHLRREQYKRLKFKENLERCWQRLTPANPLLLEPSLVSDFSLIGDLPELTADFSHVRGLYLLSPGDFAPTITSFLDYFPNVESLTIQGFQLDNIPEAVFRMAKLKTLNLSKCNVTLTPQTVEALASMDNLIILNLRKNPLELTPDISRLDSLLTLDLSKCELTEAPKGLFTSRSLRSASLHDNAITEIPIEILEAGPALTINFDFRNNPLSPESLQRVVTHYYKTGNTLNIPGIAGMPRPTGFLPDVEMES